MNNTEEQMTLGQIKNDEGKSILGKEEETKNAPKEEIKKDDKKEEKKTTRKAKAKPKEERRHTGTLVFVSGPNQTPMNLDLAFGNNDEFVLKGGATKDMIKDAAKGVMLELTRPEVDLVIVEHEGQQYAYLQNTLSKKGSVTKILAFSQNMPLEEIEKHFKQVYESSKTEARALVYYHKQENKYITMIPIEIDKSSVHIANQYDYCLGGNPNIYLVADLHSHHVMSNHFSATDDADELGKENILFGVFSFKDGWRFRKSYLSPLKMHQGLSMNNSFDFIEIDYTAAKDYNIA